MRTRIYEDHYTANVCSDIEVWHFIESMKNNISRVPFQEIKNCVKDEGFTYKEKTAEKIFDTMINAANKKQKKKNKGKSEEVSGVNKGDESKDGDENNESGNSSTNKNGKSREENTGNRKILPELFGESVGEFILNDKEETGKSDDELDQKWDAAVIEAAHNELRQNKDGKGSLPGNIKRMIETI
jgi:hypothetical protein